ncbi:mycothiol transferase [Nocardioides pakistanensis]
MMLANSVLVDAFGRVKDAVHGAVEGLSREQLTYRVDPEANTIAWLVWHLTRIQDDHVAHLAHAEQVWLRDGWADRFGLPFEPGAHGYGHSSPEVAAVDVPADLLLGYHDAVHAQTVGYLEGLDEPAYDEVIDRSWDPPVTRAVRLVSVIEDDLQHVGQAAFIRGVVKRLGI